MPPLAFLIGTAASARFPLDPVDDALRITREIADHWPMLTKGGVILKP